ncbi:MAG TPA: ornithine cyclodeaminase family protein [Thermoplasmata archaeon]|nr:ornithine cyclodeaminase family protein [Thermoplasmata archaeon]
MGEMSKVLILTKEDIESLVTMEDAIAAVEEGFKAFNSDRAVVPFPVALNVPDGHGDIHIKPGYMKGTSSYTVKIASGFYDNPKRGLSTSHGMLLLFDSRTGHPLCFEVDRCFLTDLRTAAAGAVAAKVLAKKSVSKVAVIGTGTQARMQLIALSKVRKFDELMVWGRDPKKSEAYASEMSKVLGVKVVPAKTAEDAVRGSEVVVTATMSVSPVVKVDWISGGTHITAMGSDEPGKQELDTKILARADKVVVDSLKQCARLGEVHHALEDGSINEGDVHAELGEILLGKKPGRESDKEVTVCDLTGIAIQDVAISQFVYEKAKRSGKGFYIEV